MVLEGGIRVPFVACWPGRLPAGAVRHGMASALDLFPTLSLLAGAKESPDRLIDGKDIMPMLEGKQASPHSSLYFFLGKELAAVRSGPWKLHLFNTQSQLDGVRKPVPCSPPELYNLEDDPAEQNNVASANPTLLEQLSTQARQFQMTLQPGELPPAWRGPF